MTDTQPDEVTAYLEEVRERTERPLPHVTSLPIGHDGVRVLMESAADVPRLLAAVEAARDLTRDIMGDLPGECDVSVWALREAISGALLGEE